MLLFQEWALFSTAVVSPDSERDGQVFPEHVTQKLKHGEAVISEAHECVTVRAPSY